MFFVQGMNDCLGSLHLYCGYKNLLCIIPNVCSDLLLLFVSILPAISQTSGIKKQVFFPCHILPLDGCFSLCFVLLADSLTSLHRIKSIFFNYFGMLLGTIRPSIQCKQTSFVILYPFIGICVHQP